MSFGKLIRIERQVTGQDYFCRDTTTGELFRVHVLPAFADEIEDEFEEMHGGTQGSPKGCIFLKKDPGGSGYTCAVYPDRPRICRNFTCYRMLISHEESGEVRGRVIGSRELKTEDARLQEIWKNEIAGLAFPPPPHREPSPNNSGGGSQLHARIAGTAAADDREWIRRVLDILASHGYKGDPVE